ncbi:MAG: hypothetical protein AAB428_02665 [Patescibacteria group bacterium]
MKKEKQIIALAAYAIAMAFVEAAVVVYLRELYYPNGFLIQTAADIRVIPWEILWVEVWRELATVVMLAAVGFLAFERLKERLWAFIFAFSLWDIGYYLFLYIFLRWPPSLGTTDVYFLIPWALVGPVWFPLLLFAVLGAISLRQLFKSPLLHIQSK